MGATIPHLFIGRLTRRCRVGRVHAIECVCLKEKIGLRDLLMENEKPEKDSRTGRHTYGPIGMLIRGEAQVEGHKLQ